MLYSSTASLMILFHALISCPTRIGTHRIRTEPLATRRRFDQPRTAIALILICIFFSTFIICLIPIASDLSRIETPSHFPTHPVDKNDRIHVKKCGLSFLQPRSAHGVLSEFQDRRPNIGDQFIFSITCDFRAADFDDAAVVSVLTVAAYRGIKLILQANETDPVQRYDKRFVARFEFDTEMALIPTDPNYRLGVSHMHMKPVDVWAKIKKKGSPEYYRNKVGPISPFRLQEIALGIDWNLHWAKLDEMNRSLIACEVLHHARTFENFQFEYGVGKDSVKSYYDKFVDGLIAEYGHVLEIPSQDYLGVAELYLDALGDPLPMYPTAIDGRHCPTRESCDANYSWKHRNHARSALVICMRLTGIPIWASVNNLPRRGDGPTLRRCEMYRQIRKLFGRFKSLADGAFSACNGVYHHGLNRDDLAIAPTSIREYVQVFDACRSFIERFFSIWTACWDVVDDCPSTTRASERHCKSVIATLILTCLAVDDGQLDIASQSVYEQLAPLLHMY